jgi:hypothetical protein
VERSERLPAGRPIELRPDQLRWVYAPYAETEAGYWVRVPAVFYSEFFHNGAH